LVYVGYQEGEQVHKTIRNIPIFGIYVKFLRVGARGLQYEVSPEMDL